MGMIGHSFQNPEVFLRNVLAATFSSACDAFPRSQRINASGHFAEESILRTDEAPQPEQRHRCSPADVVPFFAMGLPQTVQLGLGMATPLLRQLFL